MTDPTTSQPFDHIVERATSSKQIRAAWKSGRALPCGCRVQGGDSATHRTALIMCPEAQRLDAELTRITRPLYYGRIIDKDEHRAALEAIQVHYSQTPIYKGGK